MDDSFTGYHVRGIEDSLLRVEALLREQALQLHVMHKKLDALGSEMTPAEKAAVIGQLTVDAAKLTDAAAILAKATATLNQQ